MKYIVRLPSSSGAVLLLALAASSACASSPSQAGAGGMSGASSDGGTTNGGGDGGATAMIYGSINVNLQPASDDGDAYTTLIGRFSDGPTPNASPLELDSEEAGCKLWIPVFPFCSTPCAPDVCTADDECTPYPAALGVGTLTIEGLGAPLMLQPASALQVYQSPSLPNPACVEGDTVSASVSDLLLRASCITQLELTGPDPIPVQAGKTVKVSWIAQATAGSRIQIGLDIAHHGGKKGEIDCDVPDTGSFEIPASLTTKLVGLGVAGYPTISVTRVSIGSDARHPEVALTLASNVVRSVDTGVVSCQDQTQCSADQQCLDTHVCG